jgi:hypothetical protein
MKRYHLGGWSFGGLVSLNVAERLLALGEEISFVALLDAPLHVHAEVTQTEAELAAFYVADAARILGPGAGEPPRAQASNSSGWRSGWPPRVTAPRSPPTWRPGSTSTRPTCA